MGNLCCGGNGLSIFPLLSHHHVPIEGIPSDDPELATIARLISSSHRRGTEERWSQIDIETRKELTHIENKGKNHGAGEELPTWEDKKPLSAKYLMTKARKIYALRREHVKIPAIELKKHMDRFNKLITVEESTEEKIAAAAAATAAAEAETAASGAAASGEKKKGEKKKKKGEKGGEKKKHEATLDFSPEAMKQVSMDERAALDMREDEYVYGEVQAKSFFELLYRLKMIHGYFWPLHVFE